MSQQFKLAVLEFEKFERKKNLRLAFLEKIEFCSNYTNKNIISEFPTQELDDCKNPIDWLFLFFTKWNKKYITVDHRNTVITHECKRRSINEVYDLILTYFPDYQLKDYFADIYHVAARIWQENKTDEKMGLFFHWCCSVRRNVFNFTDHSGWSTMLEKPLDIFPIPFHTKIGSYHDTESASAPDFNNFRRYFYNPETIEYLLGDKYKKRKTK